jgi:hypothetical protein
MHAMQLPMNDGDVVVVVYAHPQEFNCVENRFCWRLDS